MKWISLMLTLGLLVLAFSFCHAAPTRRMPSPIKEPETYKDAVDETILLALKAAILKTGNNYNEEEYDALVEKILVEATRALLLKAESLHNAEQAQKNQNSRQETPGGEIEDLAARGSARSIPPPFSRWPKNGR